MPTRTSIKNLSRYLEARYRESLAESEAARRARVKPIITISRETGAGASTLAGDLVKYLEAHQAFSEDIWTAFDKNLASTVLEDHDLPGSFADYLPEGEKGEFEGFLGEFFGLHPSSWTLFEKTRETIKKLAQAGNVILVGRGASLITASSKQAFHVRLVRPFEERVNWVMVNQEIDRKEAIAYVQKHDRIRKDYVSKFFNKDIDDPLLYHLVVNTSEVTNEEACRMIGDTVLRRAGALKR